MSAGSNLRGELKAYCSPPARSAKLTHSVGDMLVLVNYESEGDACLSSDWMVV